jgi:hypothetical protein
MVYARREQRGHGRDRQGRESRPGTRRPDQWRVDRWHVADGTADRGPRVTAGNHRVV